jgi:hypothetical protein
MVYVYGGLTTSGIPTDSNICVMKEQEDSGVAKTTF